jgi:hypothetical protein
MAIRSINVGDKRIHICAYNPSDRLALLYCEFVAARVAELLGPTISQAEAHAWLRQHRPQSAALLTAAEAGIPLPREVPIGQFPIDPTEAGPQAEIAAHLAAQRQMRLSRGGNR